MKTETNTLTGLALDWSVSTSIDPKCAKSLKAWLLKHGRGQWRYSTDWSYGGPLIESEKIECYYQDREDKWAAWCFTDIKYDPITGEYIEGSDHAMLGDTPLIAVARCFVSLKLGNEVDVPEGLT